MPREEFERLVTEEFPNAIPKRFQKLITNIVLLVEDEPSEAVRQEQGLEEEETLLGYYRGVPLTARGNSYGLGETLPDSVTLYQDPIESEASRASAGQEGVFAEIYEKEVRKVIRETIWHEVAHHFGFDDDQVEEREERGI